jgi:tetratricopeptide (TPR) repeat protein
MTPRPADLPHDRFVGALHLAREGRFADAIASAERELARPEAGGDAAGALGEVARLALAAGALETAVLALGLALRARPGHADLHYRMACVLLRLRRNGEARAALDKALEINPRYVAARVERAQLDAREGFLGEALGSLRALSQELPLAQSEDFRQGLTRLDRGEWEEAQAHFGRALESGSDPLRHRLDRFEALMREDDVARAMNELHEAIAEHPAYPDLHARLGRVELTQGHWDDAAGSFARALELNPSFHDARVDLARVLDALGMRAQAVDQLALVLDREPAHARALDLHGRWSAPQARPGGAAAPRAKAS